MSSGTTGTNATRVLDGKKVAYRLLEYAATEFTAEEACEKLALPADVVFKTLVVKGDRTGPLAAVIPTGARLSSKKLARVSGNRSVSMVSAEEMERLTGYVKGGCSPFGMRKALPLYVHETASSIETFTCSAGRRGVQVQMNGADFVAASGAVRADVVED